MGCDQANRVHGYHDGELASAERLAMEAHLGECAECRGLLRELSSLSALLAGAGRPDASRHFIADLAERCRAARDRNVLRLAGWLTGAAAAVLLGALLTWPGGRHEMTGSPEPWEIAAMMPATDLHEENGSETLQVAQWMADELNGDSR